MEVEFSTFRTLHKSNLYEGLILRTNKLTDHLIQETGIHHKAVLFPKDFLPLVLEGLL